MPVLYNQDTVKIALFGSDRLESILYSGDEVFREYSEPIEIIGKFLSSHPTRGTVTYDIAVHMSDSSYILVKCPEDVEEISVTTTGDEFSINIINLTKGKFLVEIYNRLNGMHPTHWAARTLTIIIPGTDYRKDYSILAEELIRAISGIPIDSEGLVISRSIPGAGYNGFDFSMRVGNMVSYHPSSVNQNGFFYLDETGREKLFAKTYLSNIAGGKSWGENEIELQSSIIGYLLSEYTVNIAPNPTKEHRILVLSTDTSRTGKFEDEGNIILFHQYPENMVLMNKNVGSLIFSLDRPSSGWINPPIILYWDDNNEITSGFPMNLVHDRATGQSYYVTPVCQKTLNTDMYDYYAISNGVPIAPSNDEWKSQNPITKLIRVPKNQ